MQKLMSRMRCAMQRYNMVSDGDKIAVGLSGGKDSVAMLVALAEMRRFYPAQYSLTAISLDPCFNNEPNDYSALESLCAELEIPYIIKRTELGKIIFETRAETNPCSLCARMRRGALHDAAKGAGCGKIALGHHMDDAAETFLMNLLNGGHASCFSPVSYLSRKELFMIRPMILARESDCVRAAAARGLPVVKSRCPADGVTERQEVKTLIASLDKKYGCVSVKITDALRRSGIDGW